jgi:hypothetical protein
MNKPLDEDAITRAMLASANLASSGTPEQRAGMFRPAPDAKAAPPKARRKA